MWVLMGSSPTFTSAGFLVPTAWGIRAGTGRCLRGRGYRPKNERAAASAHGGDRQHPLELLRQSLWGDLHSHSTLRCLRCAQILYQKGSVRMTSPSLQASVAERIKALYAISRELEQLFPGRHYTPDGHMVGSIGEALAASWYGLELFTAGAETHDAKAPDGRLVQIKATQIDRVALSSEPEWLLVMKIHHDGIFIEEYNGPGALAWEHCGKMQKNGQRPISLAALKQS